MNKNNYKLDKKIYTWDVIYLWLLLIWILLFFMKNTTVLFENLPNTLVNTVRMSIFFILFIRELALFKYLNIQYVLGVIFIGITCIAVYFSKQSYMLDTAVFIFASKNVDFNYILKWYRTIITVAVLIVVLLTFLGVTKDITYFQNNRIRHSMGFRYTSFLSQYVFYLTIVNVVLIKKYKFYIVACFLALNYSIFLLTDTKFPFYLSCIFIITTYFFDKQKIKPFFMFKCLKNCMLVTFCLSFFLTYIFSYNIPVISKINDYTTGRLVLGKNALNTYGIKLWGQKITMHGATYFKNGFNSIFDTYNYIDSGYLQMLLTNGWIFTLFIIIGITIVLNKYVNDWKLIIAYAIISIHAMFDPQFFYLWFSPFILIMGNLFQKESV